MGHPLVKVLTNRVRMDLKYEHASILGKRNEPICYSCDGDIQIFLCFLTYGPPGMLYLMLPISL